MPDNDEIASALLTQVRAKRTEAQTAWQTFAKARDEAKAEADKEGLDVTAYLQKGKGEGFDKIDEVHKAYNTLAQELKTLEAQWEQAAAWSSKGPSDYPANASTATESKTVKVEWPQAGPSMGEQIVNSEQFKALKEKGFRGDNWRMDPVEIKATVTEAASGIIQPQVVGGILPILFRRLTVADLMPNGQTDSNTVRYLKETTATNAAAAVTEGNAKPESTLIFSQVDEPVRKIATFLPVSDEMLEDQAQIRSYIEARLRLFVQLTEEDQLLNGSGTPPNITGILNRAGLSGPQARGTDSQPDAVHKAITLIRLAFLEPDGIVEHPTDYQTARLSKDTTGQYYGGGPFTGAYGNGSIPPDGGNTGTTSIGMWGLRQVVTPAITQGTALVGAFMSAAQVFRRSGLTVEASNGYQDFFAKNLTAFRAEERLALAVYRPAAFCAVTGL